MWNPFRHRPLLPLETRQFIVESYQWLLKHLGEDEFYQHTQLILPTREFFPIEESWRDDLAQHLFLCVRDHAGMANWPCRLVALEKDPNPHLAATLLVQDVPLGPAGTFAIEENEDQQEVLISYNPGLLERPDDLIATFAHELMHYLIAGIDRNEPPPGGWENEELLSDIGTVFLGFGLFTANGAFRFEQYAHLDAIGWRASTFGYLTEKELAYALAVFLQLKNIPYKQVYKYCTTNIKSYLKQAAQDLQADLLAINRTQDSKGAGA